jgi:hypothetical protein
MRAIEIDNKKDVAFWVIWLANKDSELPTRRLRLRLILIFRDDKALHFTKRHEIYNFRFLVNRRWLQLM